MIHHLVGLLLLTMTVGPIGAVPYAIEQGVSTPYAVIIVCFINVALVPVWFQVLEIFGYSKRYSNYLTSRARGFIIRKSKKLRSLRAYIHEFERRFGHFGFFIGVAAFSFVFGTLWASAGAYFLNLKKRPAMASISIGVIANTIVFGLASIGALGFLPDPRLLYVGPIGAIVIFYFYGRMRERKMLQASLKQLKKERNIPKT